jgi:prepilin-type N-terminal cleavage/methylation domain-containing protein
MLKRLNSPIRTNTASDSRGGFTLVEVIIALVILAAAVLGLAGSATKLTTAASSAELRALALYSVEDRITQIDLDTRYSQLETLYDSVQPNALGLPGFTRTTTITHITNDGGETVDYKVVSVVLDGPQLTAPVSRRLVVPAP